MHNLMFSTSDFKTSEMLGFAIDVQSYSNVRNNCAKYRNYKRYFKPS